MNQTVTVRQGKSVPIITSASVQRHVVSTTTVGAGIIVRMEHVLRALHVEQTMLVQVESIVTHRISVCITIMSVQRIPIVQAGIIVRLEASVR